MRWLLAPLLLAVACEPARDDRCTFDDECAAGEQCVAFRCGAPVADVADAGVESEGEGVEVLPPRCITKCTCAAGEVCREGRCSAAPATCSRIDDCGRGADGDACEDFVCNGFTNRCFDDDPAPCSADEDCSARPGCGEGCRCAGNQTCVPDDACTVADEATTCPAGSFCDRDASCQPAPACVNEVQCAPFALTCAAGVCARGPACTSSADCSTPATYCNEATGFCAQPLCSNGGISCADGEQCSADGRCVLQGSGAPCDVDESCLANEFCSVVNGAGQCSLGCRSNASCASSEVCNGAHTCVDGPLGGAGDACAEDVDCGAGLVCATFDSTCVEPCTGGDCAVDGCCAVSSLPCCGPFGFCGDTGC